MRLGLTGIRETAAQPQAQRGAIPASTGAGLAKLTLALTVVILSLAACDAGSSTADSNSSEINSNVNERINGQVNARANPHANASVEIAPKASALLAASAVKAAAQQGGQTRAQVYESVRKMTAVGKQLFFDPSLSGSVRSSLSRVRPTSPTTTRHPGRSSTSRPPAPRRRRSQ